MPAKYAFIDRDGTLIYEPTTEETKPGDVPYQIDSLEKLKILPGVITGLRKLLSAGYRLVMVSNQDGLGTDLFPMENFFPPQNRLLGVLKENGITFEEILICPHLLEDRCRCRKPKIGLLDKFLKEKDFDRTNSIVIGNSLTDKKFAEKSGLKFIEIKTNATFNVNV